MLDEKTEIAEIGYHNRNLSWPPHLWLINILLETTAPRTMVKASSVS